MIWELFENIKILQLNNPVTNPLRVHPLMDVALQEKIECSVVSPHHASGLEISSKLEKRSRKKWKKLLNFFNLQVATL